MNVAPTVRCAHCGDPYTIADTFDRCSSSYPGSPWLYFSCRACGRMWVLEVSLGRVALGTPTNPSSFLAFQQAVVPGLIVDPGTGGVRLQLGGRSWFIPAGPGGYTP